MQFIYKVKDREGNIIKGSIEANDLASATASLHEQELFLIEINETRHSKLSLKLFGKKVPVKEKIVFTKQLGVMIKSGLSIIEALEALQEETQNKYFSAQIGKLICGIKGGAPLSKALEDHRDIFSEIYINMIKSGERSGKVEAVLERLSKQLEKDYDLNRKLRSALTYPIFVLFALIVVAVLVLTYIIPQLTVIFEDAEVDLPAITKFIISLSDSLQLYGLFYLIGLAGTVFALLAFKKSTTGRRFFDRYSIKIPVFGTLLQKTYIARFTRNFAALSSSGLPLLDVFKVTAETIGNTYYREAVEQMSIDVKSGKTISAAIKKSALFPKMVGQLSAVGEKSGSVDQVFDVLADFYDKDIDNMTSNFSTLLEPIVMLILGAGVGFLIVAVLQPMYGLVNAV